MAPWWLLGALAIAGPRTVDLADRTPVWLAVDLGPGFTTVDGVSPLYAVADRQLRRRSTLDPQPLDSAEVGLCLEVRPLAEPIVCRVLVADRAGIEILIQLVGVRRGERDAVRLERLDVARLAPEVLRRLRAIDPSAPLEVRQDAHDQVADLVYASLRRGEERSISTLAEVAEAVERSLEGEREVLSGFALGPEVEVDVRPEDAEVGIDDRALGPAGGEGLLVRGLAPGPHLLRAEASGHQPAERAFVLPDEGELRLELALLPDHRAEWIGAAIAGGALVAGGVAVAVHGATTDRPAPENADLGPFRLFYDEAQPAIGDDAVGEGPLVVGLAAGLIASGGILAVLGVLGQDQPRGPWWEVLAALGAGLAVYGATEAYAAVD